MVEGEGQEAVRWNDLGVIRGVGDTEERIIALGDEEEVLAGLECESGEHEYEIEEVRGNGIL